MTAAHDLLTGLAGDGAGDWDRAGRLPEQTLRGAGSAGLLCAQVPAAYGGLGMTSLANGELTAHAGSLCGSLRSVMTSQGIAAWTLARHGGPAHAGFLRRLTGGDLAGVAFSEPHAGSDLSAMHTRIRVDGDSVVVDGRKVWVTGAAYADLLVVFGKPPAAEAGGAGAVAVVPTAAAGVAVEPVPDPLGCRAAGHAHVTFDAVRLPVAHLVTGTTPLPWLVTSALTYGRMSVAWGCVGILRACRAAAVQHARQRRQFGRPLAEHQLVARHLAELLVAERTAAAVCEQASRSADAGSADHVGAAVLAKYVAAGNAARAAATAVQVLGSAGASDGHVVARAHRDAKLMEIVEGSTEISQLLLAEQALAVTP